MCELQTRENLSWDEELLKNAVPSQIDYTSPTLQMNVAVALGKNNPQQCGVVYNRYGVYKTKEAYKNVNPRYHLFIYLCISNCILSLI